MADDGGVAKTHTPPSRGVPGNLGTTVAPDDLDDLDDEQWGKVLRFRRDDPVDRRYPPRQEPWTFRVRITLTDSEPLIWRDVDVRSDLTLDIVHRAIQSTFSWEDTHLHRFAIGGNPFDPYSQVFASAEEISHGDIVGDPMPDSEVRLDETLRTPGDVLHYAYDYGDGWELTVHLDEVKPLGPESPNVVCVDGARAAPPEDCGHLTTAAQLATVLPDPAAFDVDEVNAALTQPFFALAATRVNETLVELVGELELTPMGPDLIARLVEVTLPHAPLSDEEWATALRPYQWFLDGAGAAGLALTKSGYLKPDTVEEAMLVVPTAASWIGTGNREHLVAPILIFRQSLQSLGLLRKSKDRLLLTPAGRSARTDPTFLRRHLAVRLAVPAKDEWTTQANLFTLLYAATSGNEELPLTPAAQALTQLGWATQGGSLESYDLMRLPAVTMVRIVTDGPDHLSGWREIRVSLAAAALARAALTDPDSVARGADDRPRPRVE